MTSRQKEEDKCVSLTNGIIYYVTYFTKEVYLAADGLINFRNGQAKDRYTLTYALEAIAVNCY